MKKLFFVIFLFLFPAIAWGVDQCCLRGPGECSDINSHIDMQACESRTGFSITLDSSCKDAPECMISEELPQNARIGTSAQQRGAVRKEYPVN